MRKAPKYKQIIPVQHPTVSHVKSSAERAFLSATLGTDSKQTLCRTLVAGLRTQIGVQMQHRHIRNIQLQQQQLKSLRLITRRANRPVRLYEMEYGVKTLQYSKVCSRGWM